MDFLKNRSFRQTLLCRYEVALERTAQFRQLAHLRVASQSRPETEIVDVTSKQSVKFLNGRGTLTTSDPVMKAALIHLKRIWPASVPFVELVSLAQSTATGRATALDSKVMSSATESLAETFLRCFATATIDLRRSAPRFAEQISDKPHATALTRAQAVRGPRVTSRLHEIVTIDDIQRQVVAACDGQHSASELIEVLCDVVQNGDLILHHDGRRITDRESAHKLTSEAIPPILRALAQRALLIG